MVLLTDPHVDYLYTAGTDKDCKNYLCCRADSGFPTERSRQASPWGEYKCDLPEKTLRQMLIYIRDVIKPDVLFWTGDNSPHAVWENSEWEAVESTRNITNMMIEIFKRSLTNITIIPLQGNHDHYPSNIQDFSIGEGKNQIDTYAEMWLSAGWLKAAEYDTFRKYGFYSKNLTLNNGKNYLNTTILAINTMACYYYNFEVLKSRYDPGN